jgi:predicted phage terminase large subunit-like protein
MSDSQTTTLSPYELQQLKQLASNYKLTPATLAHKLNPYWKPAPFLLKMALEIAQAIIKGNQRLVISVPPRHGKSELITKYTTIWILEHFPWLHVILATYGADLSTDFGRKVRDIIAQNQDLLTVELRRDANRADNWVTQAGGGMISVGLGGPITGRGANIFIIDDYIKEIKEATSQAHRDYIWAWFVTTALTRLEPGATMIIIATRWHHDDLIGRILKENPGGRWKEIWYPALAVEGVQDALGRQPGEPLFPERFPLSDLLERKETLGSYFFNALYQQRPENDQAKLTNKDWLEIVDQLPPFQQLRRIRVWDFAATPDGGDYTVGTEMAYHEPTDTVYILNVIRRQLSSGQVEVLVRNTAVDDSQNVDVFIEQEPGSSGKALIAHYQNNVLPEFNVYSTPTNDGKLARAQPFLGGCEAGKVKLLRGHWNAKFLSEFDEFPSDLKAKKDDQVDTAAAGYVIFKGTKVLSSSWGRNRRKELAEGGRTGQARTSGKVLAEGLSPEVLQRRDGALIEQSTPQSLIFGRRGSTLPPPPMLDPITGRPSDPLGDGTPENTYTMGVTFGRRERRY